MPLFVEEFVRQPVAVLLVVGVVVFAFYALRNDATIALGSRVIKLQRGHEARLRDRDRRLRRARKASIKQQKKIETSRTMAKQRPKPDAKKEEV